MKTTTFTLLLLMANSRLGFSEESAKEAALHIIEAQDSQTVIASPQGGSRDDQLAAAALQAQHRLALCMKDGQASEESIICYALVLLEKEIAYAGQNDSAGTRYKSPCRQEA